MDMKVRVRVWSCMGDAELSSEHTMARMLCMSMGCLLPRGDGRVWQGDANYASRGWD